MANTGYIPAKWGLPGQTKAKWLVAKPRGFDTILFLFLLGEVFWPLDRGTPGPAKLGSPFAMTPWEPLLK